MSRAVMLQRMRRAEATLIRLPQQAARLDRIRQPRDEVVQQRASGLVVSIDEVAKVVGECWHRLFPGEGSQKNVGKWITMILLLPGQATDASPRGNPTGRKPGNPSQPTLRQQTHLRAVAFRRFSP